MFYLKKILAPLFFPIPLCLEIMALGLIFLWFTKRQKTGKALVTIGALLLALLSYEPVADWMVRPLEYRYPASQEMKAEINNIKWVVVLGGGHISDPELPITGQLGESSLARLVEGVRLKKRLPDARLLLSGGGAFDPVPNARLMANLTAQLGVDKKDMVLETQSRDTKDEARHIKKMVGKDKFFLVTTASHMPRSMALFKKQGMKPIPAPTDFEVKETQGFSPAQFFPWADNLRKVELALHEYLGLAWAKIRGQI